MYPHTERRPSRRVESALGTLYHRPLPDLMFAEELEQRLFAPRGSVVPGPMTPARALSVARRRWLSWLRDLQASPPIERQSGAQLAFALATAVAVVAVLFGLITLARHVPRLGVRSADPSQRIVVAPLPTSAATPTSSVRLGEGVVTDTTLTPYVVPDLGIQYLAPGDLVAGPGPHVVNDGVISITVEALISRATGCWDNWDTDWKGCTRLRGFRPDVAMEIVDPWGTVPANALGPGMTDWRTTVRFRDDVSQEWADWGPADYCDLGEPGCGDRQRFSSDGGQWVLPSDATSIEIMAQAIGYVCPPTGLPRPDCTRHDLVEVYRHETVLRIPLLSPRRGELAEALRVEARAQVDDVTWQVESAAFGRDVTALTIQGGTGRREDDVVLLNNWFVWDRADLADRVSLVNARGQVIELTGCFPECTSQRMRDDVTVRSAFPYQWTTSSLLFAPVDPEDGPFTLHGTGYWISRDHWTWEPLSPPSWSPRNGMCEHGLIDDMGTCQYEFIPHPWLIEIPAVPPAGTPSPEP
jgi:hypothetical protein